MRSWRTPRAFLIGNPRAPLIGNPRAPLIGHPGWLLIAAICALSVAGAFALSAPTVAASAPTIAAGAVSPLPASDYLTRPVCSAPAPGHAACLALELVPRTAAARARTHPLGMTRSTPIRAGRAAEGADGLRPEDLRDAYFPGEQPAAPASEPQTIALVDAYDDPHAEADLGVYDQEFGLPPCTEANGCFEKVNQRGETGHPPSASGAQEQEEASGWALEISTDIEVAHAVCQNCHILLVEANTSQSSDLDAAEEAAVTLKATEISNSWGGQELGFDSAAFNQPGTVITASAGDNGYRNWTEAEAAESGGASGYFAGADYPASSPHVVAVGGTKLTLAGETWHSETVWNEDNRPAGENNGAGGGGCSEWFTAPQWQQQVPNWSTVGCGSKRAVADVAADADPYTGVAVYDSVPYVEQKKSTVLHWVPIGGTSVASPIVASMFALAGGAHGVEYPASTLYSHLGSTHLHDILEGGNGECHGAYPQGGCSGSLSSPFDCGVGALICNAAPGYDGPTGVGSPNGIAAFKASGESNVEAEEKRRAEEKSAEEKHTAEKLTEEKLLEEKHAKEKLAEEKLRGEEKLHAEEREKRETQEREEQQSKAAKEAEEKRQQGGPTGVSAGAGAAAAGPAEERPEDEEPEAEATEGGGAHKSASHAGVSVRLYGLTLTASASYALAHGRPTLSRVAFLFHLNAPTHVRVVLAREVKAKRHPTWAPVSQTLTLTAAKGRDHGRLRGNGALAPGRYRLTLTPLHGAPQSIALSLR
jgi:hypothetical protein